MSSPPPVSRVFVTVGTTSFDKLVQEVDSEEAQLLLREKLGVQQVIYQIGHGKYTPKHGDYFRFTPSLATEIERSDMIISHGGAGSILEALRGGKRLIAVANDVLMDDHQKELLQAMGPYCEVLETPRGLTGLLSQLNPSSWQRFKIYASPDLGQQKFRMLLMEELGRS